MGDVESQGGGLSRLGSNSFLPDFLAEPLVPNDEEDDGGRKHVHWSASTTSLTGLTGLSFRDEPPDSGSSRGEYAKNIVYGGLDSIVTSFVLVAAVCGYGIGLGPVLVLGFATLAANGMFKGFGHYSYSKVPPKSVPNDGIISAWDVQNDLHSKAMTLLHQCEINGMETSDAMEIRKIFWEYKDLVEEQAMKDENEGFVSPENEGFVSPENEDEDEDEAWKSGIARFVSFLCFGSAPLLSLVILQPFTESLQMKFLGACVATAVILLFLGIAKALICGEKVLKTTAGVLFKAGFAGIAAYGISWCLANGLGID